MIAMKPAKARQAAPNPSSLPTDRQLFTLSEVANYLEISRSRLNMLVGRGLVPQCRQIDGKRDWLIAKVGAVFLKEWLPRHAQLGSLWRDTVSKAAAKADPECASRQEQFAQARPRSRRQFDLTEVLAIRKRRAAGETLEEIAEDYCCDDSTISYICSERSYAEVESVRKKTLQAILAKI
jgi:hypothetical protein